MVKQESELHDIVYGILFDSRVMLVVSRRMRKTPYINLFVERTVALKETAMRNFE